MKIVQLVPACRQAGSAAPARLLAQASWQVQRSTPAKVLGGSATFFGGSYRQALAPENLDLRRVELLASAMRMQRSTS